MRGRHHQAHNTTGQESLAFVYFERRYRKPLVSCLPMLDGCCLRCMTSAGHRDPIRRNNNETIRLGWQKCDKTELPILLVLRQKCDQQLDVCNFCHDAAAIQLVGYTVIHIFVVIFRFYFVCRSGSFHLSFSTSLFIHFRTK